MALQQRIYMVALAARPAPGSPDHATVQWASWFIWLPAVSPDSAVQQAKDIIARERYDLATPDYAVYFAGDPRLRRPLTKHIQDCITALGNCVQWEQVPKGMREPDFTKYFLPEDRL